MGGSDTKLSDPEFMKVALSHQGAGDHMKLADHCTTHAIEHENDAKMSEELAARTSGHHASEAGLDGELRHYPAHSREAAEAPRNLAKIHQDLAREHQK
jgi:hypothetical protein